jgi:hypothetical protein
MLRVHGLRLQFLMLSLALLMFSGTKAGAGTWAWQPSSIGISPANEALAGGVASFGGSQTLWYNPAGLATMEKAEISVGYVSWFADTHAICAHGGSRAKRGNWGLGLIYFDRGEVSDLDMGTGLYTDTFKDSDISIVGGYGISFPGVDWLSLGGVVGWTQLELLGETASFTSFSAGLGISVYEGSANVGAIISGLGNDVGFSSGQSSAEQARMVNLGLQLRPPKKLFSILDLAGNAELNWQRDEDRVLGLGVEIGYSGIIFGRIGYLSKDETGLKYGLGVQTDRFAIDFAFSSSDNLGSTQHVALRYSL